MKRQTGSALVITLLIISVLSTVSFSITALAISEFRKSSAIQDSVAAYYAAESGLEHGLLQNRLWRDAELSKEVYDYVRTAEVTSIPQDKVPTKELKAGTPQAFRVSGSLPPGYINEGEELGMSWYDLKMYYRGPEIGKVENGVPKVDPDKSPRIYRDSAIDLSTKGMTGLRLAWEADPATLQGFANGTLQTLSSGWMYFVEVILTVDATDRGVGDCPLQLRRQLYVALSARDSSKNPPMIDFRGCKYQSVRIKPWNMNYMQYSLVLFEDNQTVKFDNNSSVIQSIGNAGKARRTLEIALPRSNKTILEAEDFLFISADEKLTF